MRGIGNIWVISAALSLAAMDRAAEDPLTITLRDDFSRTPRPERRQRLASTTASVAERELTAADHARLEVAAQRRARKAANQARGMGRVSTPPGEELGATAIDQGREEPK